MKLTLPTKIVLWETLEEGITLADDINIVYGDYINSVKSYEIGFHDDTRGYYFLYYSGERPSKSEIAKMLKTEYDVDIKKYTLK